MLTQRISAAALLCLVATFAVSARAGILTDLTATATFNAATSRFDYAYVLTNPRANVVDGEPYLFFDFGIEVPSTADLADVTVPTGWFLTYEPGDGLVEWSVLDLAFALRPGGSLDFAFSSPLPPADTVFSIVAIHSSGGAFQDGPIIGPHASPTAAVPEPASLIPFALGFVGLAARRRLRDVD